MYAGSSRQRAFRLLLAAILRSSVFRGWGCRTGPRVQGHIAGCGRRKAGAGTSLSKCPQFPCPRFKFSACWLSVMTIHDRPRFKPVPHNAWLRFLGSRTLAVVSSRRARLSHGEHRGQTAREGQCGNDLSRQSNHCLDPSKTDGHASIRRCPLPSHARPVGGVYCVLQARLRAARFYSVDRKPDDGRVGCESGE
jgi:hypothetical protein